MTVARRTLERTVSAMRRVLMFVAAALISASLHNVLMPAPAAAFSYSNGTVHPVYTDYVYNGSDWVRYVTYSVLETYGETWPDLIAGTNPPPGSGWMPTVHVNGYQSGGWESCDWLIDCGAGHGGCGTALGCWRWHATGWTREVSYWATYTDTVSCGSACWTAVTPVAPEDTTSARLPEFDPSVGSFPVALGWEVAASTAVPLVAQGSLRESLVALSPADLICNDFSCDDPSIYLNDDWQVRPRPGAITGRVTFSTRGDFRACATFDSLGCDFFLPDPQMASNVNLRGSLPTIAVRVFSPPASPSDGLGLRIDVTISRAEIWHWIPTTEFVDSGPCIPSAAGCIRQGEWVELDGQAVPQLKEVVNVPSRVRVTLSDGSTFGSASAGLILDLPIVGTVGN